MEFEPIVADRMLCDFFECFGVERKVLGIEQAERDPQMRSHDTVPAQTVEATLACSLAAGVWKPKDFLGR